MNALSKRYRGEETVKYILDQYGQAEPALGNFSSVGTTHFTKAAIWAFKAKLFLNEPVYADVYSDHYNFSTQDMDSVILYSTKVIDLGDYGLSNDYFGSCITSVKAEETKFALVCLIDGGRIKPTPILHVDFFLYLKM